MKKSELKQLIKEEIQQVLSNSQSNNKQLNEWWNKPDSYRQGFGRAIQQLQGIIDGDVRGGFMDDAEFIQSKRNEIQQIINTLETFQLYLR